MNSCCSIPIARSMRKAPRLERVWVFFVVSLCLKFVCCAGQVLNRKRPAIREFSRNSGAV